MELKLGDVVVVDLDYDSNNTKDKIGTIIDLNNGDFTFKLMFNEELNYGRRGNGTSTWNVPRKNCKKYNTSEY